MNHVLSGTFYPLKIIWFMLYDIFPIDPSPSILWTSVQWVRNLWMIKKKGQILLHCTASNLFIYKTCRKKCHTFPLRFSHQIGHSIIVRRSISRLVTMSITMWPGQVTGVNKKHTRPIWSINGDIISREGFDGCCSLFTWVCHLWESIHQSFPHE